jgi:hypothetical protein
MDEPAYRRIAKEFREQIQDRQAARGLSRPHPGGPGARCHSALVDVFCPSSPSAPVHPLFRRYTNSWYTRLVRLV